MFSEPAPGEENYELKEHLARLQGSSVLFPRPDWRKGDLDIANAVYGDEGRVKNIPPGGLYAKIEAGCSRIEVECSRDHCFFHSCGDED